MTNVLERTAETAAVVTLELYDERARRGAAVPGGDGLLIRLRSSGWPFEIPAGAAAELTYEDGRTVPLAVANRRAGELLAPGDVPTGKVTAAVRYGQFRLDWQPFVIAEGA
ncbi:MAG: hypothetical protein LBK41_08295 [Clostridiales bacterium]|jgi:hypothetical protein|nr:hypothetical protein [Clostridiales bacterium]